MRLSTLLMTWLVIPLVMGQPTITVTDGPVAGDQFILRAGVFFLEQQSGIAQTWDYSNIGGGTPITVSIAEASSSTYAGSFPDAQLVMTGDGNHSFFTNDVTGLYLHGYASFFSTVTLSNTSKQLAYPMEMGASWTDNYSGLQGSTMFSGTLTCVANGYGTLQMPYGDVDNALRISCHNIQLALSNPQVMTVDSVVLYYKNGFPWYLIRSTRRSTYHNGVFQGQQNGLVYGAELGTGLPDRALQDLGVDLYPNPAQGELTVNATLLPGKTQLFIHNAEGRLILSESFPSAGGIIQHKLDVRGLSPGIYVLQVMDENGHTGTRKFMVE